MSLSVNILLPQKVDRWRITRKSLAEMSAIFVYYKKLFEKIIVIILNDVKQFVNLHQKNILS